MTRNIPTSIYFYLYQPIEFNPEQIEKAVRIAVDEGLLPANKGSKNAEGRLVDSFYSGGIDDFILEIANRTYSLSTKADFEFLTSLVYPISETNRLWDLRFYFAFTKLLEGKQSVDIIHGRVSTYGDYRATSAKILLNIATRYFSEFMPSYGHLDFSYKPYPRSIIKTLRTQRIQELYWANFFGKDYVQHYGMEFFQKAPVWKTTEIRNNGVLVQLSPEISPASKKSLNPEMIGQYFQTAGLKVLAYPTVTEFKLPQSSS